jgi:CheY-like chemotaxis protein
MDQHKIMVLVVDDNEVIQRTLAMKLKASGYDVMTASDGSQALSTVRRKRPDLILLDISFPPDVAHGGGVPWDGFRIIEWFKRMDEVKGVPIIIITAGEAAQFKDRALAAGAAAFFHKPIDNDELLATIQQILGPKATATSA